MKVVIEFELNEDTYGDLHYMFEKIEHRTMRAVSEIIMAKGKPRVGDGEGIVHDMNGNKVGTIKVTEE